MSTSHCPKPISGPSQLQENQNAKKCNSAIFQEEEKYSPETEGNWILMDPTGDDHSSQESKLNPGKSRA